MPTSEASFPFKPVTTIHIVDDDAAVRNSMRFLLEAFGWPVRTYASGGELLAEGIAEPNHGWLVLDYNLPGMDGLTLLARLRLEGVSLPAILMTGRVDAAVVRQAQAARVVALLPKPLDDDRLLDLLRRGGPEPAT